MGRRKNRKSKSAKAATPVKPQVKVSKKTSKTPFIIVGILLVTVLIGFAAYKSTTGPGLYDDFAQCITESGAKFYGAFWCPHCQDQKREFGKSMKKIAYIECSTPDGNSQTPACQSAGIESYPTWEFGDGSRQTGALSFFQLAEATGCSAPSR